MLNNIKYAVMYTFREAVEYFSKPIVGIIIGIYGVWLGVVQHYLGSPNSVVTMLVGIACLVLANIHSNINLSKELQGIKDRLPISKDECHKESTYKVAKSTYITK